MTTESKSVGTLQPVLFPLQDLVTENALFFSVHTTNTYMQDDHMCIESGALVDFNSYFNSFSSGKWNKYTNISSAGLRLMLRGQAEVSLYYNYILYGQETNRCLLTRQISAEERTEFLFDFGSLQPVGSFSFAIKALDDCELYDAAYMTNDVISKDIDPNLAIVFCTYNREAYIRENLERIASLQDERIHSYVVDNASSLNLSTQERVTVISNCNAGGAGGFSRGMMQVIDDTKKRGYTHCILMDDDILLDPRVLIRLKYFLSYIKEEYRDAFVSGAMFRRDLPYFHVESGAIWNKGEIKSAGHGLDMRNPAHCLKNEYEEELEYAAWWFCVIPMSVLGNHNLPLPLFVFNDDVDFSLRNRPQIITINGICVWHDAFESKITAMRRYYESRNRLVVNSVNGVALSAKELLKQLADTVKVETYLYKYENVNAMLDGIEDFLKGPDWLCSLDPEVFNKEVMKKNVAFQDIDPLTVKYDWYRLCCTITDCDRLHKWVRILTRNGLYLPADREIVLPFYAGNVEAGYRATQITYYDEITHKGYVALRDKKKIRQCFQRYRRIKKTIKRNYDRVKQEYEQKKEYLTSREMWEKYLGLQ